MSKSTFAMDGVFWLHPDDHKFTVTAPRALQTTKDGTIEIGRLNRHSSTDIQIFIPEHMLASATQAVLELAEKLKDPINPIDLYVRSLRSLKAAVVDDGYLAPFRMPPINSGLFHQAVDGRITKSYSLFRNVFFSFHLRKALDLGSNASTVETNSRFVIIASYKDRAGWEIGRVQNDLSGA